MWQGIHGHDEVIERFRQSLQQGRLASSYLFLGPEGVGKRTFAIRLAQALFCQRGKTGQLEPCGQCESCQLMLAGNHPDLDVIGLPEGKRWLPVDLFLGDRDHRNQVGLCHNVSLRPQMSPRRVAIIDDADNLTTESANCLLKTLEEPPHGSRDHSDWHEPRATAADDFVSDANRAVFRFERGIGTTTCFGTATCY